MDEKKEIKKGVYEKPQLKKSGNLKDITARGSAAPPPAPTAPA